MFPRITPAEYEREYNRYPEYFEVPRCAWSSSESGSSSGSGGETAGSVEDPSIDSPGSSSSGTSSLSVHSSGVERKTRYFVELYAERRKKEYQTKQIQEQIARDGLHTQAYCSECCHIQSGARKKEYQTLQIQGQIARDGLHTQVYHSEGRYTHSC